MPGFRLTPEARSDMIGIRRFSQKRWGKEQSKKYMAELRATFQLLSETSVMGIRCTDIYPSAWRFPYASHVIYYTIDQKQEEQHLQLVVFAVLHENMQPSNHLPKRKLF